MQTKAMMIFISALFICLTSNVAFAQFHQQGSLTCSACHTMHDSDEGADVGQTNRVARLLNQEGADLCLSCHNGDNSSYPNTPDVFNVGAEPELSGGDFNYVAGAATVNGHDCGGAVIGSDTTPTNAPGGNFSAANLSCATCHDPHFGNSAAAFTYRNLKKTLNGVDVSAFINDVNSAEAVLLSGSANVSVSDVNHNVYVGDFGAWCSACHSNPDNTGTGFHGADKTDSDVGNGTNWLRHPTDTVLGATLVANYDIGTAGYKWNYPLEKVGGTWTVTTVGTVAVTDKVFCLSCHKAHASAYSNATRWDTSTATGLNAKCSRCHNK